MKKYKILINNNIQSNNNNNRNNNQRYNSFFSNDNNNNGSNKLIETNRRTNFSGIDYRTTNYKTGFNNSTMKNFDMTLLKSTINIIKEIKEEDKQKEKDIEKDKEKEKENSNDKEEKNFSKIISNKNIRSTMSSFKSKKFEDKEKEKEKERDINISILSNSKIFIDEDKKELQNQEKFLILEKLKNKKSKNNSIVNNITNNNEDDQQSLNQSSKFLNLNTTMRKKSNRPTGKSFKSMHIIDDLNINEKDKEKNLNIERTSKKILNFNKTFLSTSSSGSEYQLNLLNKMNLIGLNSMNSSDFFATQFSNFTSQNNNQKNNGKKSEKKKISLPALMSGFNELEKQSTDIKVNLSQAINEIDRDIELGSKYKDKYKKEVSIDFNSDLDVFIYGENGSGYYMSNKKVFDNSEFIKKIDCDNVLRNKKFFMERLNMCDKKNDKEEKINNGLGRHTEENFNKVFNLIEETDEIKMRSIKKIENYQMKVYLEALKENQELEDMDNEMEDDNY
jgi:hypothetical protein